MSGTAALLTCVVPSPLLCCVDATVPGGMSTWRASAVPVPVLSAEALKLASYPLPSEQGTVLDKLVLSDNQEAGMVALQTGRNQPR